MVDTPVVVVRVLTGDGMRHDLVCTACADELDLASRLMAACEGCVARALDWGSGGWRGEPEVRHRDRPVVGEWTEAECAVVPANDRCLAALPAGWLVLTADHELVEVTDDGGVRRHGSVVVEPEESDEWAELHTPGLHTSPGGRFAAVVTEYGARGVVVDLSTGSVVLRLDRHDYEARTTPFPVAFARCGDDTVVIAATEWNRLDVFEAATGRLLTERATEREGNPEHLDYFHGMLALSPSGRWLFDGGWVWHPVGIRTAVDVEAWLAGDVYAAENGTRLGELCDEWDHPVAWVDDATVAVQRLGENWQDMIDGVQLIDVPSGRTVQMFAGPAGPMWAHGRLLYVAAAGGLEIWSPAEEARVGFLDGFRPTAQNPRTGAFAELAGGRLRCWAP